MAKTTCKGFAYAPVTGGGDGSAAIAYGTGAWLDDYLAKVDISEDRTNEKEYADGHLIDMEKIPVAVSMTLELVNNTDAIKKAVLGLQEVGSSSSAELVLGENDPPFVGAGVLMANRYKGTITWEGYWIYKIQFTMSGVSAETRRDRTSWQHETIEGEGVLVEPTVGGGKCFYAHKTGMTEQAAVAWLKAHAGIT